MQILGVLEESIQAKRVGGVREAQPRWLIIFQLNGRSGITNPRSIAASKFVQIFPFQINGRTAKKEASKNWYNTDLASNLRNFKTNTAF